MVKYYQINKIEIEPDKASKNGEKNIRIGGENIRVEGGDAEGESGTSYNSEGIAKKDYNVRREGQSVGEVGRKRRKVKWIVYRVNNVFGCLVGVFERLLGLIAKL